MDANADEQDVVLNVEEAGKAWLWGRFNYGIIMESDATENKQREMLDLCQIACEKFAPSEKPPKERDNQAAANMIKNSLDDKYDGPFNVIVGESFSLDVDYVQSTFFYMIFGG